MQLATAVARLAPGLLKHWVGALAPGRGGQAAAAPPDGHTADTTVFHMSSTLRTMGAVSYERRGREGPAGARAAGWRDALLAAPQDVAGLLLAVAASGGAGDGTRIQAFAALAGLADFTAPALRQKLWASKALPAVFELALNHQVADFGAGCASSQRSGVGSGGSDYKNVDGTVRGTIHSLFVIHYLLLAGEQDRLAGLLLGWLDVARPERQPALNRWLAAILAADAHQLR